MFVCPTCARPLALIELKAIRERAERDDLGAPIDREVQRHLLQMRDELGLTGYLFAFG